jgi:hypothetical protein
MAYIGREPQIGNYQVCDAISVVNGQAAYTMQVSSVNVIPESVNHMIVSLNGVIQNPGSSYTISSSTITFSSNLATGDSIDFIYLLGNVLDLGTPSDSTVTTAKLSGNLVTPGTLDVNGQELILDADADTSITADTDDQIDIKVAGADDFRITANTFTALSGSGVVIPDSGLTLGSTAVTSTAAELNLLDGVSGLVQADLTKLAAVDSTAAELNIVDGGTSATSTTIADADRVVLNDNGTMVQAAVTDLKTYIGGGITMADQWRLSTTLLLTDSNQVLANNERVDTDGYGQLGTGMSHSSGTFTFPSTGIYLITVQAYIYRENSGTGTASIQIETTTDNSSYSGASNSVYTVENVSAYAGNVNGSFIFDVTNTTTHKVKIVGNCTSSNIAIAYADSNSNATAYTFIRLGDT